MTGAGAVLALFLIVWTTGWGAVAAWTQTWREVKRGHFRITAWIVAVLGILSVAANEAVRTEDLGAQPAFVVAMGVAGIGYLLAQYAGSDVPGAVMGALTGLLGASALVITANFFETWNGAWVGISLIASAALFGAVTNGMMLGHWYLNQPGLKPWALARLTVLSLTGVVVSALVGIANTDHLTSSSTSGAVLGLEGFGENFGWAFFFIWLSLILFTGGVVWMARRCIKIRSIQSATGLYYVAILTAGVAVFLHLYLTVNAP